MNETNTETKENTKLTSRKFIVWLTWIIISFVTLIVCVVMMIVNHSLPDSLIELVKDVLKYLFSISMMYLGVNVGQKIGFAVSNAISENKENKC